jgi:hypothetical protein
MRNLDHRGPEGRYQLQPSPEGLGTVAKETSAVGAA